MDDARDNQPLDDVVSQIVEATTRATRLWADGWWAPGPAAALLQKSRLDWQASLARSLCWRLAEVTAHPDEPASLIIAWVHLRSLVEGALKLYLSVWYCTYLDDASAPMRRSKLLDPDGLTLEQLRQFVVDAGLLRAWHDWLQLVQSRGNAVHAFRDRTLGDVRDFESCVREYLSFFLDVASSLPEPDGI